MVVGPEFSPVAAVCVALARPRWSLLPGALSTLVVGFAVAVVVASPLWLLAHVTGLASRADAAHGPSTDFIVNPDQWSFVIALLAGVAGVLALTTSKSGTLVGVFISVTTVPAAGAMALALALGGGRQVGEAAAQLGINLVGILLAALTTLLLQRGLWRRMPRTAPRVEGVGRART
jgi:uncharacterized hydrophobic protein (TIGR00271 family)